MTSLSTTIAIIATTISSPLRIGLILLAITTIVSLATRITILSSWFSYILFLIFIGGMIVLFIYVARISPNEKFKIPTQKIITIIVIIVITILLIIRTIYYYQPWELIPSITTSNITENSKIIITKIFSAKIYNKSTYSTTIITILYLLITLIAVVKITNSFEGPMRNLK